MSSNLASVAAAEKLHIRLRVSKENDIHPADMSMLLY